MGCCPFHDDTTASLSVGGIPERFKCFGCDAGGDVIEFVARLHHLSFTDAVNTIRQQAHTELAQPAARRLRVVPPAGGTQHAVTADRAYDINQLAWQHFSTPVATAFADSYLRHHRGLDLTALKSENL